MAKVVLGAKIENPFGPFGFSTGRPSGTDFVCHEEEQYPVSERQIVYIEKGRKWLPYSFDNGGAVCGPARIILGPRQRHEDFLEASYRSARTMRMLALFGIILPVLAGAGWLGQRISGDPVNAFTFLVMLWGGALLFGQWLDTANIFRRALSRHYQKHGHYTLPMHTEAMPDLRQVA